MQEVRVSRNHTAVDVTHLSKRCSTGLLHNKLMPMINPGVGLKGLKV